MREQISGSVGKITYHKEETGFTVLELDAGHELITVVGNFPDIHVGEQMKAFGQYLLHPSFGMQFRAEDYEHTLPVSSAAILRYLSSGALKGVGPATARRLVGAFGEKTLEILEKSPERLCEIKGLSQAKAREITEEFARQSGVREVMLRLAEYGIQPDEAMTVYKALGQDAPEMLYENPFVLCTGQMDFSFERVDAIASALEKPTDAPGRLKAGILHILRHNLSNGHTCLPKNKLVMTAVSLLEISKEEAESRVSLLVSDEEIIAKGEGDTALLFLPELYKAESYCAARLRIMLDVPPTGFHIEEGEIRSIEEETGVRYARQQLEAVSAAMEQGILILTGGPGTGKTTTLNAIIKTMQRRDFDIALAAPTGRAAKRMSELTGMEAKTLHRLLEAEWSGERMTVFGRCERNPLSCDIIIVDELSMVDALLFEALLRAMPLGCRLIMVGDSDQLPSVGAGNVLADLIDSGILPVVKLKEIFRQAMSSLIVTNAHRIVAGEQPELSAKDGDFFMLERFGPSAAAETVTELCLERLPGAYGFSPLTDIQILCPSKKRETGTANLNSRMQSLLNPPDTKKRQVSRLGYILREGDKVMQMKNNYDVYWEKADGTSGSGVFNGDVGILAKIDPRQGTLSVRFDDRTALYGEEESEELELAYAMTVHKSQGSEFECVIIPALDIPEQLCYRNLLYTGVTRAKRLLVMVGSRQTVFHMVNNNRRSRRYTALRLLMEA
ncbi:MAG TPA: ATP-dependent RecD-like DNA helicase [Ruminococcaceae bacterium]|nr:ATP-dependent RecD-like DNA helicase [Oscillospiraceae bacterium]